MKKGIHIFTFLAFFATVLTPLSAQSNIGVGNFLIYSLIALGGLLLLWAIYAIVNSFLGIEADKVGIDLDDSNKNSGFSLRNMFNDPKPIYAKSTDYIPLTKGYDINLAGGIEDQNIQEVHSSRVSISPFDFRGISPIPKVVVEVGEEVVAGQVLFYDKVKDSVKYVAPISGEIVEINRGAKRSIAEIVILADKETKHKQFDLPDLNNRDALVAFLAESGLWVSLNERPFDIVPELDTIPRDIFVTTFDTAPLAPDSSVVIASQEGAFAKGIEVLTKLTEGKVHIGLDGNATKASAFQLQDSDKIKNHYFSGPHPAGNVGIQIHQIKPIGPADKVWTMHYQDVIRWGKMFLNGQYDGTKIYAVTGAELAKPTYIKSTIGASLIEILKSNITGNHIRVISGDVLSGKEKNPNEFVGFRDDQITVVREGDEYELFGWLLPFPPKPSVSSAFPNFLYKDYEFKAETNTHGEERAFVVTGQYEKVLPMDIYPQHLMKAILTEDIEKMEGLGITELSEEDVALCEFVCTSKAPLQHILREGLDLLRAQG